MPRSASSRPLLAAVTLALVAGLAACDRSDPTGTGVGGDRPASPSGATTTGQPGSSSSSGGDTSSSGGMGGSSTSGSTSSNPQGAGAEIRQDAREAAAGARSAVGDAAITTQVNAALALDKELAATQINVDTQDGMVSLRGSAPSQAARDRAARLAQGIEGVKSVQNELQVGGAGGSQGGGQSGQSR